MGQRTLLGILDNNDKYNNHNKHVNKKCQKNVPDIKKTFFEHILSSKMGRGVLAVTGGSGGKPIFDPKSVEKMFFNVWDIFLHLFCHSYYNHLIIIMYV